MSGSTGGVEKTPLTAAHFLALEDKYGAHNYHPMPVVISRGEGVFMFDVDGKRYMDFLSAYSAVNQGHCHPEIVAALCDQAKRLTLTSRAFYNNQLGLTEKFLCELFGYDKCLMMNSGAEAVETAIKLARRWGYDVKRIPADQAVIITASENFHGRTSTIVSFSTDPECYTGYGPRMPGFVTVEYDNLAALEEALEANSARVCAFLVEPIQGEAGAVVPKDDYIAQAAALCRKHNCLLICDEIQTGLGRAGALLASSPVRPDIVCLGKALSGGLLPISCCLADDSIMLCIKPGQHGSTFGGSPLACAIARTAVSVLLKENMIDNSVKMGDKLKQGLENIQQEFPNVVKLVRGRGLMLGIVIQPKGDKKAWDLCEDLMEEGLLCKPTHDHIIRIAPPLIITDSQVDDALAILRKCVSRF